MLYHLLAASALASTRGAPVAYPEHSHEESRRELLAEDCLPAPDLSTLGLAKYPGSSTDLLVMGKVSMSTSDGTEQTFVFDLDGLDTACTDEKVAGGLSGNACGIHIHSGTSCAEADLVGGHYYQDVADPWSDQEIGYVAYYTAPEGSAKGVFTVDTGFTSKDLAGRAFVVHDSSGARIACALMQDASTPLCVEGIDTYPGYYGNFGEVQGEVTMVTVDGTAQYFDYALSGLDTGCAGGYGTSGNSCGLHIHSGTSCAEAGLVGGHYAEDGTPDPWTEPSLSYVASAKGRAEGSLSAITGGSSLDVVGRAFVVHGYDGGRIACGLLAKCPPTKCIRMPSNGDGRPGNGRPEKSRKGRGRMMI